MSCYKNMDWRAKEATATKVLDLMKEQIHNPAVVEALLLHTAPELDYKI